MTDEQTTSGNEEESDLIKDLRKQINDKNDELKFLRPLKVTNALLEAGLGKLSDDHKTALLAVAGENPDTETLAAKAKALGFSSEPTPPETTTEPGTQEQAQQQQQIQGEVQAIENQEGATSQSSAKPDARSFTDKIKGAKDADELMRLIENEGEEHRLLVSDEF